MYGFMSILMCVYIYIICICVHIHMYTYVCIMYILYVCLYIYTNINMSEKTKIMSPEEMTQTCRPPLKQVMSMLLLIREQEDPRDGENLQELAGLRFTKEIKCSIC